MWSTHCSLSNIRHDFILENFKICEQSVKNHTKTVDKECSDVLLFNIISTTQS